MNQDITHLNELIEITRDGQHFYQHALEEVKDIELQHLFRDMAQAKTHIIQALSVKVAANQEQPAQGGTTAGKLREMYADTKARLGDSDAVYIDQLDQTEERILAAHAPAEVEALGSPCNGPPACGVEEEVVAAISCSLANRPSQVVVEQCSPLHQQGR